MYRKMCILCQQTSPKRWFGNRTTTSKCDVIISAHQIQIYPTPLNEPSPWKFSAYATAVRFWLLGRSSNQQGAHKLTLN